MLLEAKAPFGNTSWNKWLNSSISCSNECRFLSWFCDCEQKDDMAYIDYAVANIFANPLAYLKNEEPDVKDADDEVIEVPLFLEKIKVINKSSGITAFNNCMGSDNHLTHSEFIIFS